MNTTSELLTLAQIQRELVRACDNANWQHQHYGASRTETLQLISYLETVRDTMIAERKDEHKAEKARLVGERQAHEYARKMEKLHVFNEEHPRNEKGQFVSAKWETNAYGLEGIVYDDEYLERQDPAYTLETIWNWQDLCEYTGSDGIGDALLGYQALLNLKDSMSPSEFSDLMFWGTTDDNQNQATDRQYARWLDDELKRSSDEISEPDDRDEDVQEELETAVPFDQSFSRKVRKPGVNKRFRSRAGKRGGIHPEFVNNDGKLVPGQHHHAPWKASTKARKSWTKLHSTKKLGWVYGASKRVSKKELRDERKAEAKREHNEEIAEITAGLSDDLTVRLMEINNEIPAEWQDSRADLSQKAQSMLFSREIDDLVIKRWIEGPTPREYMTDMESQYGDLNPMGYRDEEEIWSQVCTILDRASETIDRVTDQLLGLSRDLADKQDNLPPVRHVG